MAKGKVTFNEDNCKGCGMCVSACPVKIISLNNDVINSNGYHPPVINEIDKCIACASCALMCPDVIITVEKLD